MYFIVISVIFYMLIGCSTLKDTGDGPPAYAIDINSIKEPVPHEEPLSAYGNAPSYRVNGQVYHVLNTGKGYHAQGIASWYGKKFNGQLTSTREVYDMLAMTAASPVLPLPTYVQVTNLENHRHIIVRVNDRGPFHEGRILDLSYAAASKLDMLKKGTALVQVDSITLRPLDTPSFYYVQVGAFKEYTYAEALSERLKEIDKNSIGIIKSSSLHNPPLYQVQIGPVNTLEEAQNIQSQLEKIGLEHTLLLIR